MTEYWKQSPNYWCKHCKIYVRDSKIERANHDSTSKHQNAVKRALTTIHRDHERGEREADRAKREIERLNGVVSGTKSSSSGSAWRGSSMREAAPPQQTATEAQRQQQLEQLAGMGVNIPDNLRSDMAMVGEWTVTNTKVIQDTEQEEKPGGAKTTSVKKRELEKTEEEKEEDSAVDRLFKKQKKWGRDSRTMPTDDAELDALLSGGLSRAVKKEESTEDAPVKQEEEKADGEAQGDTNKTQPEQASSIKQEPETPGDVPAPRPETAGAEHVPAVVFKKRKPKNVRQK